MLHTSTVVKPLQSFISVCHFMFQIVNWLFSIFSFAWCLSFTDLTVLCKLSNIMQMQLWKLTNRECCINSKNKNFLTPCFWINSLKYCIHLIQFFSKSVKETGNVFLSSSKFKTWHNRHGCVSPSLWGSISLPSSSSFSLWFVFSIIAVLLSPVRLLSVFKSQIS